MKTRAILGLVGAAMLLLSAAAHSLLGWPSVRQRLAAANAPADLVFSMQVGWHFGGVAMLAFAVVTGELFLRRLRGEPASTLPAVVVAAAYLAFGAWALLASGFEPFFLVFIVPALLLVAAATGPTAAGR